jgi:hypothetical protein
MTSRCRAASISTLLLVCSLCSPAVALERGLGARPPTPAEQAYIDAVYSQVRSVAPNDLARARAAAEIEADRLDGAVPAATEALPTAVDNSTLTYFPPIRSQGSQGSCTCWAAGYYYDTFTQAADEGYDVSGGDDDHICSPAFLYPLVNGGYDGGANTQYVMTRLNDIGCSSWSLKPYSSDDWTSWPSEAAWVDALDNRTQEAHWIDGSTESGLDTAKQHLANGNLAVTSFDVYSTWYDYYPDDSRTGIDNDVYYYADGDMVGGHAVTLVGYDDSRSYVDHRDGETHYGAFLVANSWDDDWGVPNSTGIGGSGYFWVAYEMFLDSTFGPWVYYNDDRPDYGPRLYGVTGLNHPERWDLELYGGVGEPPDWWAHDVLWFDGGPFPIADDKRVAIDLTDGIPDLGYPAYVFIEVYNDGWSENDATMTSADFYVDLDEDGSYSTYSSPDPPLTIPVYDYNYALCALGHEFGVYANPPAPATVFSEGTVSLSATYADTGGHGVATWSWSDGAAGGSFSPSASVQDPTYTAPTNVGAVDVIVTLTVSATCDGAEPLGDSDSTILVVEPLILGAIEGTVSDALSSAPIEGALVTCGARSTTTNAAGEYLLTEVPAGSGQTVTASAAGYQPASQTGVTVIADTTATVDLSLVPLPGSIGGLVTEGAGGAPIAGVTVTCGAVSDTTGADGSYLLAGIPVGDGYTVTAASTAYVTASVSGISVASQETTPVSFALVPKVGSVVGHVRDGVTGLPIAGAAVGCGTQSTTTDVTGVYRLEGIRVGWQTVTASAAGYASGSVGVMVATNETTVGDVPIMPTVFGTVAGRVTSALTGYGIAGAQVTCGALSVGSDSSGNYTLTGVPVGSGYRIGASAPGYYWGSVGGVSVSTGVTTTVNLTLTLLGSTSGVHFEDLTSVLSIPGTVGLGWGDYDSDGYPDLLVAGATPAGSVPDQHGPLLYHNNGDRTFTDVSASVGLDPTPMEQDGVAWSDYDNDGDLDALVGSGAGYPLVYRWEEDGFAEVGAAAGFHVSFSAGRGVAWCDYDGDGLLDAFCSNIFGPGYLMHNNGDGTFTEVSASVGLSPCNAGQSASWGDYNNDGWPDLVIARLGEATLLFANDGDGTFTDVSVASGVSAFVDAYSAVWGDYDNDGWLDCYVTSANYIEPQTRRDALFHSNTDGTFTDVAGSAGMAADVSVGLGAAWADYNNDGYLDIYVGNLEGENQPFLYRNDGDGTFTNAAATAGVGGSRPNQAACWADIDLDGWIDLAVGVAGPESCLFRNLGGGGNWLRVIALTDGDGDATDGGLTRAAVGARVELDVDNDGNFPPVRTLTRLIDGGSGFCGQNEQVAQFGVPTDGPVAVRVFFPDGSVVTHRDVALNAQIEIRDVSSDRVMESFPDVPLDSWAYTHIDACVKAGVVAGHDDACYHGTWSVSRDQMAVFIARAVAGGDSNVPGFTGEPSFADVPADYWALKYVEYAVSCAIVGGYGDDLYHPEYNVDRGQMAVFVARSVADPTGDGGLESYDPPATPTFPDVATDFWSYKYIEYIADPAQAIAGGYGDGLYHHEALVSRDQMAVYIAKAFGLGG